jgi:hypothetical protein
MKGILKSAFLNAFGTAVYIVIIASLMYFFQESFPKDANNFLIPIAMLLLFVFSAALTGFLVFGKPAMIYLDGKKKEAISLLFYTLGILLVITVFVFVLLIIYFRLFI